MSHRCCSEVLHGRHGQAIKCCFHRGAMSQKLLMYYYSTMRYVQVCVSVCIIYIPSDHILYHLIRQLHYTVHTIMLYT